MPILIFVSGPANTGKTTGMRAAMVQLGINSMASGDVTIAVPAYRKQGQLSAASIGFATGGDNISMVTTNIAYLQNTNADVQIYACRSYGGTYNALVQHALTMGAVPIWLKTPHPGLAAAIVAAVP
ncbi:MAG: hypothetical protein M9955_19765 [Rhizobiaceae bacterium]|nr:hypothetical protein [Rhizobiaceae bacterium]